MCEIDWSVVLDFVKAVPPILIAGIVGWVAFQQWRTAKDKLALDLFDRRFAAHRAITASMKSWSNEPYRVVENVVFKPPSEHSIQLNREVAEARFLFGDDVREQLKVVVKLLDDLESAKDALHTYDRESDAEGERKARRMMIAFSDLAEAQSELDHRVERYMMLNKISVGKPKERVVPERSEINKMVRQMEADAEQEKAAGVSPSGDGV